MLWAMTLLDLLISIFFQIHILSELTIQCVIGLGRYVRFFKLLFLKQSMEANGIAGFDYLNLFS